MTDPRFLDNASLFILLREFIAGDYPDQLVDELERRHILTMIDVSSLQDALIQLRAKRAAA